jgi:hypothetical protein
MTYLLHPYTLIAIGVITLAYAIIKIVIMDGDEKSD